LPSSRAPCLPNARPTGRDLQTPSRLPGPHSVLGQLGRQLPNPAISGGRHCGGSTEHLRVGRTYAPLQAVLAAEEADDRVTPPSEVLNYVRTAEQHFRMAPGRSPPGLNLLTELHGSLVRGTAGTRGSWRVRTIQVVIGGHRGGASQEFTVVRIPRLTTQSTGAGLADVDRGQSRGSRIDPVVAAGMAHYPVRSPAPFTMGTARIGRLRSSFTSLRQRGSTEPTLDRLALVQAAARTITGLMAVSTHGDWDRGSDSSEGHRASAIETERL